MRVVSIKLSNTVLIVVLKCPGSSTIQSVFNCLLWINNLNEIISNGLKNRNFTSNLIPDCLIQQNLILLMISFSASKKMLKVCLILIKS
ncbi:hypothetical protein BpHYR1_019318 [Brachionus plicatilis]|uniref:Uncharacterized protein n=1 Tax=Brachionus plicatilis TaxID=10195 RepID=A0A3M7PQ92_BRAPC|nr:hypothetical protein BpHYR1_019318 [Brachionus plicatilis]